MFGTRKETYTIRSFLHEADGDASPLGQRPLSVLAVVYLIWASARMVQLDDWCRCWVLDSVTVPMVVGGRWRLGTLLDIGEVLSGLVDSDIQSVLGFSQMVCWMITLP